MNYEEFQGYAGINQSVYRSSINEDDRNDSSHIGYPHESSIYVPNPNTSIHADISSHIRNQIDQYDNNESFLLNSRDKIGEIQRVQKHLSVSRKTAKRKFVQVDGQLYVKQQEVSS